MNWRKHMVLLVGGGAAVVLLIASLFFLFRFQGRYGDTNRELESARLRLQQLNSRNPFPSEANVKKMQDNLALLRTQALQLQSTLQKSQIRGENMEPAEFAPLLEKTSRRMQQKAQESGVTLPAGFAFGFPRYAAGELPAAESVFRLVGQLRAVETVCDILFQARIAQIDALDREVFEETGVAVEAAQSQDLRRSRRAVTETAAPSSGNVPKAVTNELYSVERITVNVQGRETAIWDVLNGIVRHPAFLVLADVKLDNTLASAGVLGKKTALSPMGGDRGPGVPPQFPAHDDRIVAGRENVAASLVIDLYHFHTAFTTEALP